MAITVIFPDALWPYVAHNERVFVDAKTASEALAKIFERYPELQQRLPNDLASPPPGVAVYRNGLDLRRLQGLDTPLAKDDRLTIVVPEAYQ